MTILLIVLCLFINVNFAFAQEKSEVNPLYQLPQTSVITEDETTLSSVFLVGSDNGLYKITSNNNVFPLWEEGRVDQLIQLENSAWLMRTSKGIFYTEDLVNFEERTNGLPFLTIKKYIEKETSLHKQIHELKDLCVNPQNNLEIVTATKDNVYFSRDGGLNWKSVGSMSKNTAGIKAVAVATIQDETVIFMSHPIFGFSYCYPNRKNSAWIDVTSGFEMMPTLSSPDEIADILPVVRTNADGTNYTEIYVSQSYLPRLYKFNWQEKKAELIYKDKEPIDCYDGLTTIDNVLVYSKIEGFGSLDIDSLHSPGVPTAFADWNKAFAAVPGMINTAWIPSSRSGFSKGVLLNELWLLYPGTINTPYAEIANGKKSIYVSAYQCRNQEGIDKFKKVIKDRNMNSLVIDMKDDYGLLRYDSKDPLVLERGQVSQYAVDLDHFIEEFKKENIYLIARIVTFKDRTLSKYAGGKYAVWDKVTNKPWLGIKGYEETKDEAGNVTGKETLYYDEHWVDPYSEEVWEYNIKVAQELINRGFDEIQFDYIRFPTDGRNLRNAQYRWQNKGMDMESALISFLSYARQNINAPIGIDIYGANGWYRSGTRTGQDSELLAEYVDVIGPMFYPSHFEQSFLNYIPPEDRTYRIYYYGSFRNTIMCRNRAIIRPWVQSFYLNVSYDRKYYNSDYVKKQFFGVRDSINRGYMCWNNSGEYGTTPPDILDDEAFIGTAPESSLEFRKPAIGTKMKPLFVNSDVSVLDSILKQDDDTTGEVRYTPFLQIPWK